MTVSRRVAVVAFLVTAFAAVPGANAQTSASAPVQMLPALTVFSAGSAKAVLTAIFARYREQTGQSVMEVAGSAGLMLDRIEAGEPADLFISANMGYARQLTAQGKGTAAVVFAHNQLCVIALPSVGINGANIIDRLLDPKVRIGSSNPANDPSGQYAFAVFEKAGKLHPGAAAILKAKVMILGGTPAAAPPMATAATLNAAQKMAGRGVDAMVSFCSTSDAAPDTSVTKVEMPSNMTVPVAYGMTVLTKFGDAARRAASDKLAAYLLSPAAQAILVTYGFQPAGPVAKDQL